MGEVCDGPTAADAVLSDSDFQHAFVAGERLAALYWDRFFRVLERIFSEGVVMNRFKFELEGVVRLSLTAEAGVVVGRAEFTNSDDQYLVRYMDATGHQKEGWFAEDSLGAGSDAVPA